MVKSPGAGVKRLSGDALRRLFMQAAQQLQQGELESAERGLRKVLKAAPGSAAVWYNLGLVRQTRGDLDEAAACYRKALKVKSDDPNALFNLGCVLQSGGRFAEARTQYERVIAMHPGYVQAYNNLGNLLADAGDLAGAEASLRKAVELADDYADPYLNLANVLSRTERFDAAEQAARQYLARNSRNGAAYNTLGEIRFQQEQAEDAIGAFRRALELDGSLTGARYRLGGLLQKLGRFAEAEQVFRVLLERLPGDVEGYNGLGVALDNMGRHDDAEQALLAGLGVAPDNAALHNNLGNCYSNQERMAEAEQAYRKAVSLDATLAGAYNNLGFALASQGRKHDAEVAYRQALAIDPRLTDAYRNLAMTIRFQNTANPDVCAMEALLKEQDLGDGAVMPLHFALGKAYDDCGEFDRAFRHFSAGNAIKHRSTTFDVDVYAGHVDRLIATFDEPLFGARAGAGLPDRTPIFIVGMPRSGTTLVEQIIASHPAVHGAGELTEIEQIVFRMENARGERRAYPECVGDIANEEIRRYAAAYLLKARRGAAPGIERITDKMPFNFAHLGLIALLFPCARIVHCRRHPLDTALSIYFQYFPKGVDFAYDLEEIGQYYRQYQRLMRYWHEVLPMPVFDLQYEDLVDNTEAVTRALIDYLALPWDDACLAHHRSGRAVRTASVWQVREPIYRHSVARWRGYESHLAPLMHLIDDH